MSSFPSANMWYTPSRRRTLTSSTHDFVKMGLAGSLVQWTPSGEVAWPRYLVGERSSL